MWEGQPGEQGVGEAGTHWSSRGYTEGREQPSWVAVSHNYFKKILLLIHLKFQFLQFIVPGKFII